MSHQNDFDSYFSKNESCDTKLIITTNRASYQSWYPSKLLQYLFIFLPYCHLFHCLYKIVGYRQSCWMKENYTFCARPLLWNMFSVNVLVLLISIYTLNNQLISKHFDSTYSILCIYIMFFIPRGAWGSIHFPLVGGDISVTTGTTETGKSISGWKECPSCTYVTSWIRVSLTRQNTRYRRPVPVELRVAICLWRLATNLQYRSISHLFGAGMSTACQKSSRSCYSHKPGNETTLSQDPIWGGANGDHPGLQR